MPLRKENSMTFHRTLYGTILESVTFYKRGPNQQAGTVTTYTIYQCKRRQIQRTGEIINGGETVGSSTTWTVPRCELDRLGIGYITPLDMILDKNGRWWQPEAPTIITDKLFSNFVNVDCLRVDPPGATPIDE